MQTYILLLAAVTVAVARQSPHNNFIEKEWQNHVRPVTRHDDLPRASTSVFLNNKTQAYAVDGANFPLVPFDIGESYAGTLPISSNNSDPDELFFWFFPSIDPSAHNQITVWLQGGPGCSSMIGLLEENGPFLWQEGVREPFPNPYSWTNLTNMVWIDQPVGIGLAPGITDVPDDATGAEQFSRFWKNFVTLFDMQGYEIYLTGESYAGSYIPNIAENFILKNDTSYYNVSGIFLGDPMIDREGNGWGVQSNPPAVPYVNYFNNILNLNSSTVAMLNDLHEACGYAELMETYLSYPPPQEPMGMPNSSADCATFDTAYVAAQLINLCFNIYHITDYCPYTWNQFDYDNYAAPQSNYFNLTSVQEALHVGPTSFTECAQPEGLLYNNTTPASNLGPLPRSIEKVDNVIIANGWLDFLLPPNGTLLAIQNMTWNGYQGFQSRPEKENFFVPYDGGYEQLSSGETPIPFTLTAGGGWTGDWHTERGLTFVTVYQSGHEIPQYTPGAAYRIMEYLLGRIDNLGYMGGFTTM